MKLTKKIIALVAAITLCVVPFFSASMTVKAEGPTTYSIQYEEDYGQWRYQEGLWSDSSIHREIYYLQQEIKDGDIIVIGGAQKNFTLDLNVRLGNLTAHSCGTIVINAKGIDNVYIMDHCTIAINGDVSYAEIYGSSSVNFNNNVGTLKILSERENLLGANVSALGTVDYLYGGGKDYKHYELYNFAANSLRIENGTVKTEASKFSSTPVATPAPAPAAPSTPAAGNSGEYDDVPKTADMHFNPLWLVGMAGICLVGAYKLRKEN